MAREDVTVDTGAAVLATDGRLGTVDEVIVRPETGALAYLVVRRGWINERLLVPADLIETIPHHREVRLRASRADVRSRTADVPAEALEMARQRGTQLVIPVVEERLVADTRLVDLGELRIHKHVEYAEEVVAQQLTRDDLLVERVPINRPLTAPAATRFEGDTLVVPIVKEVLVVHKQLMLVEEIRISKRQVTEEHELREVVRRERIAFEDASVYGINGLRDGEVTDAVAGAAGAGGVRASVPEAAGAGEPRPAAGSSPGDALTEVAGPDDTTSLIRAQRGTESAPRTAAGRLPPVAGAPSPENPNARSPRGRTDDESA
jgi:uncharacterized protein (TIGR02271 family)